MSTPIISLDEWKAEIARVKEEHDNDPQSITAREFAAAAGCSECTASRHLRDMVKQGRAVATRKHIINASGVSCPVPSYRIVKKRDVKKAV